MRRCQVSNPKNSLFMRYDLCRSLEWKPWWLREFLARLLVDSALENARRVVANAED